MGQPTILVPLQVFREWRNQALCTRPLKTRDVRNPFLSKKLFRIILLLSRFCTGSNAVLGHHPNLSLKILQDDAPKHPAILLALAALSRWVADAWDDIPLSTQVADRVERQLKPHMESLLNVVNGDPDEVCAALDAAASAFREAIRRGLDSD
jgi:hypothetical protein